MVLFIFLLMLELFAIIIFYNVVLIWIVLVYTYKVRIHIRFHIALSNLVILHNQIIKQFTMDVSKVLTMPIQFSDWVATVSIIPTSEPACRICYVSAQTSSIWREKPQSLSFFCCPQWRSQLSDCHPLLRSQRGDWFSSYEDWSLSWT